MQDVIARRYALGAELGRGGMARVVAARDLRLDRPVAVKLLPIDGADPAGRDGDRQTRDAERLRERVIEWVDEGGLAPEVGALAATLLEPVVTADAPGAGGDDD
jgi:serine/threonine protein kinase